MAEPIFDKKDQLARIQAYAVPGEEIAYVFDCKGAGTGFVGVTDKRVIFFDQSVLTGHKAMVSIPYRHINGISAGDAGIIFQTSEITIITGSKQFSFEFRGADKAQLAYRFIINKILV